MSISVVIVNHNSEGKASNVIRALMEQEILFEQIIIVDNGSLPGDLDKVYLEFPRVHILELHENRGLPEARNAGLKLVKSDLVLTLDDDIYLSKGSLKRMIQSLNETNAAVVCPRIVLPPKGDTIQFDGASIHFAGTLILNHSFQPSSAHPASQKMTAGFGGACLLMRSDILKELGVFDEDYSFYFEDLELSYRMMSSGYKICCEERAIVLHDREEGKETLSYWGKGSYPAGRAYYTLRNRWLTMLIHYQASTLFLLSPALMLYEFAALVETVRRGWLREYFRAIHSLWQITPRIFHKRKMQQSRRKVNDQDILTGGDLPFARGFLDKKTAGFIRLLNTVLNKYWNMIYPWL